jgi:hypothetical protein
MEEGIMALLSLESILNIIYLGSFAVLFGYGQRVQTSIVLLGVRRNLGRLESFRNAARVRLQGIIAQLGSNPGDVQRSLERLASSFVITPISLDPAGIIGKLEHMLDTHDEHLKSEISRLVTGASEIQVNNLTNLLEVTIGLENMFRVVRHYYLQSKKQSGPMALAQLQMSLPTIMEEAEAYNASIDAFADGRTIGDGIGPLVAKQFHRESRPRELIKDTYLYENGFEGRKLLIVRAKGPGGNVGKPGLAVEKLALESKPIHHIITVDAALKLEGEESGEVAEGIGAAIGGFGIERYHIEEAATKQGIPLNAVVVKMSSKEAISPLTPKLIEASENAAESVRTIILAETQPGDTVILAGIGNSIGIE